MYGKQLFNFSHLRLANVFPVRMRDFNGSFLATKLFLAFFFWWASILLCVCSCFVFWLMIIAAATMSLWPRTWPECMWAMRTIDLSEPRSGCPTITEDPIPIDPNWSDPISEFWVRPTQLERIVPYSIKSSNV